MKLVDLVGLHLEATSGTPLVLLREHDAPHRILPIFIGGSEAASIALALSGQAAPRPLTHDLMATLVKSLGARIEAVEVTALRDGAFLAELTLHGPLGDQRVDTRPSEGVWPLALRMGAPVFVDDAVLDEAGSVVEDEPDEATIDDAVAEFRAFLDELEPGDFAAGGTPEGPADEPPAEGDH